jgi:hypothetical protein
MTAQIDDLFRHRRALYSLAGISEGELFDISALGLEPVPTCTACWRGYQALFAVSRSRLVLDRLDVNLMRGGGEAGSAWAETMEPEVGPVINGVSPSLAEGEYDLFNNHYTGLKYPLVYSGGVLLAKGFIEDLYVHMGFHPAWKYRTVIELLFDAGVLKEEFVRSDQMAEIRTLITGSSAGLESNREQTFDEITRFIDRAFDRSYGM